MIDKKTKLIFLGVIILLLIVSGLFLLMRNDSNLNNVSPNSSDEFKPEFLTAQEKKEFMIDSDTKVQVISRDSSGKVKVYRIIDDSKDVVNPEDISPIR